MQLKEERQKENSATETTHLQAKSPKGEIRVLLFVQEGPSRQRYLDALVDCGVKVFVTSSFFHLSEEICRQTYHGLFLDMSTKMKAIKENKTSIYRLAEQFPVVHLKIDHRTGEMHYFHVGRQPGSSLKDFIESQCRSFRPRKLRTDTRKELHLPVLVCRNPESKHPERTITKDISPGGCFIISTRRRKEGDEIILRFPELTDMTPIRARIRTVVKWGERRQMPGIGVMFVGLSSSQMTELEAICLPD